MYVPFSVLCVLFVCKFVLYCCHRVSTQLRVINDYDDNNNSNNNNKYTIFSSYLTKHATPITNAGLLILVRAAMAVQHQNYKKLWKNILWAEFLSILQGPLSALWGSLGGGVAAHSGVPGCYDESLRYWFPEFRRHYDSKERHNISEVWMLFFFTMNDTAGPQEWRRHPPGSSK
jgi:hypothetical protein